MKHFISQDYNQYSAEDHITWNILHARQSAMIKEYGAREFQKGFDALLFENGKVPELRTFNKGLSEAYGWSLVGVKGLLPTKEFFDVLMQSKFPVSIRIRKPEELDFSELPDIFHDICGHVPMLMNYTFQRFLKNFGRIGSKYLTNKDAVEALARFYWFTLEMGLVNEGGISKPFGAAILTSKGEISNVNSPDLPKYDFEIEKVINTPYDNLKLQLSYFVIQDFAQLDDSLVALDLILSKMSSRKIVSI